jgi:hypothetical protein
MAWPESQESKKEPAHKSRVRRAWATKVCTGPSVKWMIFMFGKSF